MKTLRILSIFGVLFSTLIFAQITLAQESEDEDVSTTSESTDTPQPTEEKKEAATTSDVKKPSVKNDTLVTWYKPTVGLSKIPLLSKVILMGKTTPGTKVRIGT